jgi:hypothetical protein
MWGFAGYCGEVGWRLMNKPVSKGEQHNVVAGICHHCEQSGLQNP